MPVFSVFKQWNGRARICHPQSRQNHRHVLLASAKTETVLTTARCPEGDWFDLKITQKRILKVTKFIAKNMILR